MSVKFRTSSPPRINESNMGKENVRQHVVPRFYLAGFADANGNVHCLDVRGGLRFVTDPINICVEKEAYSIIENGVLDKSCDLINSQVEGLVSATFAKITPDINLNDEVISREVFTHLLVFTANLIARSRTPRNDRNAQLSSISKSLKDHPDALDGVDHERYLDMLCNPDQYQDFHDKNPMFNKLRGLLLEHNERNPSQPDALATAASLDQLQQTLYPLLTPALTEKVSWHIYGVKAKAALLISDSINFITSDDPVIYLRNDVRVQGKQIPPVETWTDPTLAVLIPLKPRVALYWNVNENYDLKLVSAEQITHLNRQVLVNHVRHVFAANPGDFPNDSGFIDRNTLDKGLKQE